MCCFRAPAPRLRVEGPGGTHTEHLNVVSGSYLFHEGQRFSFGYWDGAKDDSPQGGQHLANGLDERLTEELHLPHLVDDTHALPRATSGTCLRMTETLTGTPGHMRQRAQGSPSPATHQLTVRAGKAAPLREAGGRLSVHPEQSTGGRIQGSSPGDHSTQKTQFPEHPVSLAISALLEWS